MAPESLRNCESGLQLSERNSGPGKDQGSLLGEM